MQRSVKRYEIARHLFGCSTEFDKPEHCSASMISYKATQYIGLGFVPETDEYLQGLHNKALLTHLLPSLKGNGAANAAHGSTTKLHAALLDVFPLHLATPPAVDATDSEQQTVAQGSVPAQVNLATSMLANGQALRALKLISPVCRAAFGLPDGTAIRAFCVAIESQLQLGALQVPLRRTTSQISCLSIHSCYLPLKLRGCVT